MSPVRYELVSYIQEEDFLRSHRREFLKSYETNILQRERHTNAIPLPLSRIWSICCT
jgi:hypothetical protein